MGLLGWTRGSRERGGGKKCWSNNSIVPTITVTIDDPDRQQAFKGGGREIQSQKQQKNNKIIGNHVNDNDAIASSRTTGRAESCTGTVIIDEGEEKDGSSNEGAITATTICESPAPTPLSMEPAPNHQRQNNSSNTIAAGQQQRNNNSVLYDLEAQNVNVNTGTTTLPSPMPSGAVENAAGNGRRMGRFPATMVLSNVALVIVAGLIVEALFRLTGPYRRGFFCTDDSIRLPYKRSTVPVWMLFFYCVGLSGISFIFGEYLRLLNIKTASEEVSEHEAGESLRIRLFIRWVFFHGYFFVALVATLIFTSMAKFPVGRLRPHFIDLCNPRIGNESESEYCLKPVNQHRYVDVERYSCDDGVSPALISEARLSFYSGHSSLAMCTAVFTALYLHARLTGLFRHPVVVPLLQVAVLSSAMFIGYSRIQDNMHHWSDVLIGLVAGFTVASFVALHIVGLPLNVSRLNRFVALANLNGQEGNAKLSNTESTAISNSGGG